jgi:preprotein translocase subunit SecY
MFQSLGIALALESSAGLVISPGFGFRMTSVVTLTAGTMFLMWLGEQITERGLGNGISILIFGGIACWPCRVQLVACLSWCVPVR